MKLFTLGFTKKSAEQFFELLKKNNIQTLIDIRLNNNSQLAGFTKGLDLKYFLKELCSIEYIHIIELAPTKVLLDDYKKKKISWNGYEERFNQLLEQRNVARDLRCFFSQHLAPFCLLCSEPVPDKCHRRLVAEYIKNKIPDLGVEIIHL
jgi:uncharacterized protein (DUF488 family)